jgi:tRNA nucleotidyltransferase (CCA-adding enzyme)
MQVITTHLNADFDCLASMMAAKKLYPEAKMVLSGSAEKMVHQYLQKMNLAVEITRIKEIDLDQVSLLILVDTHDPARIGVFKSLVEKPGVEVHVYDHHPEAGNGLKASKAVIKKRGAATTILLEVLKENGIALNKEESTLMALGIHEDTHSLLSVSTTPEDLSALSELVRSGADLNVVAEYVQTRLNQEQLDVLNDLVRNIELLNVNGVGIALATATADHFVEDLAYVVSRMMELENLSALIVLVRMGKQVCLIGRSRSKALDLSTVTKEFGGGGHANAASANIRDRTLVEVREKLLAILDAKVEALSRVGDIMQHPVVTVRKKDTVLTAEKTLTLFNLNTLPVVDTDIPVGLITRQIVEKAIHHKMSETHVEDLMVQEFSVTAPDVYFNAITPIIIEEKQKLIPVVDAKSGLLVGIVSRGDLLRVLQGDMRQHENAAKSGRGWDNRSAKKVKSLMKERLDKKLMSLFETIARIGGDSDYGVYVVGGFVRDLLLGIRNLDIDIVIEGDGIAFAKELAAELGGRVKSHAQFGTSVIILQDGFRVDVATARMEYYKHPAALPTVEKSSIKADLFRRDFTVNCLAIQLTGEDAFALIDHFNCERDLKDRMIRVLHSLSFIEDPSRIFRAIRFEQRNQFKIGKQTQAFMKTAVKKRLMDQLSGSRLLNEIILIMKENQPVPCIRRMREFSLPQFISPELHLDAGALAILDRVEGVLSWAKMVPFATPPETWFIYFMGFLSELNTPAFEQALERLKIPLRLRKRLETDLETCVEARRRLTSANELSPPEIFDIFSPLSPEGIIFLLAMLDDDRANKYATRFVTQYQSLAKLSLTGDDLIQMGVSPGPVFQQVFKALRDARVNGKVNSKKDEISLVEKQFLQ